MLPRSPSAERAWRRAVDRAWEDARREAEAIRDEYDRAMEARFIARVRAWREEIEADRRRAATRDAGACASAAGTTPGSSVPRSRSTWSLPAEAAEAPPPPPGAR